MKKLVLSLALAAAALAPLAAPSPAAAQRHWEREERWERREDRWERREDQWGPRDRGRWDRNRHNGYYYHDRWYYGPPPPAYFGDPYYRPGYSAWRRGAALPPIYRGEVVTDYERYRLRPPPRGFVWYQVGDAFLLTGIGSGVIFEIVPY